MHNFLQHIHLKDLVDICVVGLLIWGAIAWARRVHAIFPSRTPLFWLFLPGSYAAATAADGLVFPRVLRRVGHILVVVFQDDLRRLFERIAVLGLRRQNAPLDAVRTAVLIRALKNWPRDVGARSSSCRGAILSSVICRAALR